MDFLVGLKPHLSGLYLYFRSKPRLELFNDAAVLLSTMRVRGLTRRINQRLPTGDGKESVIICQDSCHHYLLAVQKLTWSN